MRRSFPAVRRARFEVERAPCVLSPHTAGAGWFRFVGPEHLSRGTQLARVPRAWLTSRVSHRPRTRAGSMGPESVAWGLGGAAHGIYTGVDSRPTPLTSRFSFRRIVVLVQPCLRLWLSTSPRRARPYLLVGTPPPLSPCPPLHPTALGIAFRFPFLVATSRTTPTHPHCESSRPPASSKMHRSDGDGNTDEQKQVDAKTTDAAKAA